MYLDPTTGSISIDPLENVRSHTLVSYLEDRPMNFVTFLAFVRSILCVFHLVAKFEQRVFDVIKAIRWRLPVTG